MMAMNSGTANLQTTSLEAAAARLRKSSKFSHRPVSSKAAAVLVPLFEEDGVIKVVLTKRSSKLRSHSGEVCLPGGKAEPGDADAVATALREAHEEINLSPAEVHIVATLPPVLSKHLLSVTPVIAVIQSQVRAHFRCAAAEVETIFDVPLDMFLRHSRRHRHQDVSWDGVIDYRLHFFSTQHSGKSFNIWGLTAGILIEVAKLVYERSSEFEEYIPGGAPYNCIWFDGSRMALRK